MADIASSPFPQQVFDYLARSEDRHWWFRARNHLIFWILEKKVGRMKSFLEVGCGTGYVISGIARRFPWLRLEATEYFEDGLVYAKQRCPQCQFRQLDATMMTEEASYDCIGAFDVIEHIAADELVLQNFNRALRSGGWLLLTVPQHDWLWSAADDFAHHQRRYSRFQLCSKAQKAGFQISYCTSFVSLLLPLMTLQRLGRRGREYDPDAEFHVSGGLNAILYVVMRTELLLLQLGLRFPMGGSLLLLASKS